MNQCCCLLRKQRLVEQSTKSEARFLLVQLLRARLCATARLNLTYLLFFLAGTCGITSELIQLSDLSENYA